MQNWRSSSKMTGISAITREVPAAGAPSWEDVGLRKACKDFEAMLTAQLMSQMRSTVPKSDFFGSSDEEEIFQGLLDQEVAKKTSETGAMQLGDVLYRSLLQQKVR
jgi:Rod binding domain-containing protein